MIKDLKLKISLTPSAVKRENIIRLGGVRHSYSNKHLLMTKDRFAKLSNPKKPDRLKNSELKRSRQQLLDNHVKNGVITVGDINYTTDLNTKVSTFTKELKSFLISIEEICRKHYQIN